MLVDSHCHLDFPDFAEDIEGVMAPAAEAGVGVMQTICTRLSKFEAVLALAQAHENLYCSVGIHPHNVDDEPAATVETLVNHARADVVIGIGETGLDYFYDYGPQALQRESFRIHAAAARETGLPLIVHTRDADDDTMAILEDEAEQGAFPGLIHCFSAGADVARRSLALGLSISISGIVTFKNAEGLRAIVRELPADRILVETDAPFLAPIPNRGKRNEPAFVADTARTVAELLDMPPEALAAQSTKNFFALFTKARRPSTTA